MYEGRVRLDPASAAVVIAAINALSAPRPTKPAGDATAEAAVARTCLPYVRSQVRMAKNVTAAR